MTPAKSSPRKQNGRASSEQQGSSASTSSVINGTATTTPTTKQQNGSAVARAKLPVSPRLPLPVSIELHNLFPTARILPDIQQAKRAWFRPEYTTDLLCAVQMEISVSEDDDDEAAAAAAPAENGDDKLLRTVIYSAVDERKTVCPSWHHISEFIHHNDLTVQTYENMCATFRTIDEESEEGNDDDDYDQNVKATTTTTICRTPLHPSKLCKLSEPLPYDRLPLNCALVRFTDNTVRVQAAHYQLLTSNRAAARGKIQSNPQQGIGNLAALQQSSSVAGANNHTEDFRRFEDKSFRALDLVAAPSRTRSASSASDTSPSMFLEESMKRLSLDGPSSEHQLKQQHPASETMADRANLEYLARENVALDRLVQQQERALQRELEEVQLRRTTLRQLADNVQRIQAQTAQVVTAIQSERRASQKAEFLLDASRIRLVRELAFIYPITTTTSDKSSNNRRAVLIRGIELPTVEFLYSVPEEQVGAALGMLAHATHLLSKYLHVHLRYRLHCHGSRSAIQDADGGNNDSGSNINYPLFPGRAVDREQLLYAVHLLDRNVDCLLQSRGIVVSPTMTMHVLIKVKRIYENVIEGY